MTNTTGEQWAQSISTPSFDLAENDRQLGNLMIDRERIAEPILAQIALDQLPSGIRSCAQRGSNSLSLAVPAIVLETEAFRAFQASLASQLIKCAVTKVHVAEASQMVADLAFMPMRPQT